MIANIVISIAVMLISGFLLTRLTKLLHLPNVTAYLIAGIIIRPLFTSKILDMSVIEGMSFLPDIALAFIAFSLGEFFRLEKIKKYGLKSFIISLIECLLSMVGIFILTYLVFRLDLVFSLVISAVATITGLTAIGVIVRQTNSKGEFVDIMLQTIAFGTVIGLVLYSVSISVGETILNEKAFNAWTLFEPIVTNVIVLIVGGIFGFILKLLLPEKRTTDNRLIIALAVLFGFCGICAVFSVSPLLGCMSLGTVYFNSTNDDKMFKQLNYFSPPLLLLFFVRSGVSFDFKVFEDTSLILIVILFVVIRWACKYGGSYLGGLIVCKDNKDIRNYLGLSLTPLGSVAIGLAALASAHLAKDITLATKINTVIVASTFVYELFGPALSKLSLSLSHSYSTNLEDITDVDEYDELGNKKDAATILAERIKEIQSKLPEINVNDNESAFLEAEEQMYLNEHNQYIGVHRNRRFRK